MCFYDKSDAHKDELFFSGRKGGRERGREREREGEGEKMYCYYFLPATCANIFPFVYHFTDNDAVVLPF